MQYIRNGIDTVVLVDYTSDGMYLSVGISVISLVISLVPLYVMERARMGITERDVQSDG